jgi:two-component system, LytTR family, response regulator
MDQSRIAIKTPKGWEFLNKNDIVCCVARGRYTSVVLSNGKEYLLTRLLKEIEDCLSYEDFFRTHKSYLINLNHIVNYYHNHEKPITLCNNVKASLAKRRKQDFQKRINELVQTL